MKWCGFGYMDVCRCGDGYIDGCVKIVVDVAGLSGLEYLHGTDW